MQYTLRPATAEDIELLDRIHTDNMQKYVEKVYPWNPHLFRDRFNPQDYQLVTIKTEIVGFIKVVVSATDIYLGEIQIVSDWQNQGIGTNIIKTIIQQAQLNQKSIWLKVIHGNPAENLYKRLGFTVLAESTTHKKMGIMSGRKKIDWLLTERSPFC